MTHTIEEHAGLRNRALRRQLRDLHEQADGYFDALCNTSGEVMAMGELWGSGLFDCGPQDYEYIVERCIEAVRAYKRKPHQTRA